MYFKISLRQNTITHEIQGWDKVERRIGRIIQKHPSVSTHYDIEVETNGNIATNIILHPKDSYTYRQEHLGVYFIRTSLQMENERRVWEIIRITNTQKTVTTSGQNTFQEIVSIRKCTEPQPMVKEIFQTLGCRNYPFVRKKSVVHKPELKKMKPLTPRILTVDSCNLG